MRALRLLSVVLALAGCGGSGSSAAGNLFELRASGVSPQSISVSSGGQVRFINHDTADHQIASSACAELSSPRLAPDAGFTATLGTGPKTCGFDDALAPSAVSFQGTVNVAAPGMGGY
jgi:hypothetical protein